MIVLSEFKEPDSVIRHQQSATKAVMDKQDLGVGTLFITESLLSWQGPQGFSIEYPHISLHALSKDVNLYPTECLYVMIDKLVRLPGVEPNISNNDDSDNESESEISELIFVPEDKSTLQRMYEAIKECQELHPDPADVSTDEDEAFEDMIEEGYEEDNIQNENGLNFGISPRSIPKEDFIIGVESAIHDLPSPVAAEIRYETVRIIKKAVPPKPNLTAAEFKAVKDLRNNKDIIILSADKGKADVVLNHKEYIEKAYLRMS